MVRPPLSRYAAPSWLAALSLLLAGCAHRAQTVEQPLPVPPTAAAEIGELRPGLLRGYLDRKVLPDSLALVSAPPAADSPAFAADQEVYQRTRPLLSGARGQLAARDARLEFPQALEAFACAADLDITESATPHLYTLLRRTLVDAGLSTYRAKDHHQRTRPFALNRQASCTPAEEPKLAKDGSYPSGHSAVGWAWGLVLAELMPERADALLQRSYAFGQSRVVCGVHWQSDVDAGRVVGAAAVARQHADATFQAQLRAAAAEIRESRAAGRGSASANCASEAEALKQ